MSTFAVLGPGGVGGLLGALLASYLDRGGVVGRPAAGSANPPLTGRGHDVLCLAGERTVEVLRARGLRLHSAALGDVEVPVRAATVLSEPVSACLVTVKATQLDAALQRVPAEALGDGLVVPFLNGVDHVAALRRRYPHDQVVPATMRVETTRVAPGEVVHASPFAVVEVAGPRAAEIAGPLRDAGLDVTMREDETAMLWDKLSILAPLALLTTSAGAPAGVVRTEHRDEAVAVIREVAAVARAHGAPVDATSVLALLDSVPEGMRSSMQRDAEAGRGLELDAIGGAVLRAAERSGVPVPSTTRLVTRLRKATT